MIAAMFIMLYGHRPPEDFCWQKGRLYRKPSLVGPEDATIDIAMAIPISLTHHVYSSITLTSSQSEPWTHASNIPLPPAHSAN